MGSTSFASAENPLSTSREGLLAVELHEPGRMNYVMEVGPLARSVWVVFSVDDGDEPHVELSADTDRDKARRELASLIRGQPARCCSSLRTFGEAHGWPVAPPHRLVHEIAAWAAVCGENMIMLEGMLPDPRLIDAWLEACASYVAAKPWERLRDVRSRLLDLHFDGTIEGRRAIALTGNAHQHRLVITDSLDLLLDERGPMGIPAACLSQALSLEPCATSHAIAQVHERTFVPRLIATRGGELTSISEGELLLITAATSAIASLCQNRTWGRSEVLGVEMLVLPVERELKRLAS